MGRVTCKLPGQTYMYTSLLASIDWSYRDRHFPLPGQTLSFLFLSLSPFHFHILRDGHFNFLWITTTAALEVIARGVCCWKIIYCNLALKLMIAMIHNS